MAVANANGVPPPAPKPDSHTAPPTSAPPPNNTAHQDRDDSPRATASAYDRYIEGLSDIAQVPFLFRYNAFAERHLDSLEEYAVIDLDARTTDCFRKQADGLWVLHPFASGDTVTLASVGLEITAAQLFAEVPDSPPPPARPDDATASA